MNQEIKYFKEWFYGGPLDDLFMISVSEFIYFFAWTIPGTVIIFFVQVFAWCSDSIHF